MRVDQNANPVYGRVQMQQLDQDGMRRAESLIRQGVDFAAEVTEFGDAFALTQLAAAIVESLILGTAAEGAELDSLCRNRTAEGRIRDYFCPELRALADVSVRAILALTNRTPIHEYIRSEPVRVGRDSHAIGVDHLKGAPHLVNLLICSLGCCDRNLLHQADWLLTGTKFDATSIRADHDRISELEDELDSPLSTSVEEHIRRILEAEARTRDSVERCARSRPRVFADAEIDRATFARMAYPECLIVDGLTWGPAPARSARDFAGERAPGDDDAIVEMVEAAGRYGIARCALEEPEAGIGYAALEDVLLPALAERLGAPPEAVSPRLFDKVTASKRANLLGVGANIRQVRFWHFPGTGRLLRAMEVSDARGEYLDAALWRTIGLDGKKLPAAIALVERAQQPWPRSCINRFRDDFQPGLMKASSARTRTGLLQTSLIANAAAVSAHREIEIAALHSQV